MTAVCPTPAVCKACGQPIMTRRGVRLRRTQIALFDMIERRSAGDRADELARHALSRRADADRRASRQRHVNQINDRLVETDWRIVNRYELKHGRRYFLVEEKTP